MIIAGLERAQHVTCVSETTCRELLRLSRVTPERTSIVWNGLNYPFSPIPLETAHKRVARLIQAAGNAHRTVKGTGSDGDAAPRFILNVGANTWYKNKAGVVRAYAELQATQPDCPLLVMAGAPLTPAVHELIVANRLRQVVFEVVQCSSEDLRALFSTAELLLFPSLAEGFGWPIIEAQACGCRVVTSNRAPMTEVGGDGAAFCDPRDPSAIAHRVREVLSESEPMRRERIRIGFANAARFSPEQNVQAYAGVYQRLLRRSNSARPQNLPCVA
jgi:glycosyltransferase involved in cell wall biosynthesis